MEKTKGPFAEKEDLIIISCLKKATSPNISDVVREASIQLNRSFSSVYQRYLNLGKPTLKSIKQKEQDFEDFKIIHHFYYGDPLKSWINMLNYSNIFKKDWESLMNVIDKIEKFGYFVMINKWSSVYTGNKDDRIAITSVEGKSKIINTYYACIAFIKYWNENKKSSV